MRPDPGELSAMLHVQTLLASNACTVSAGESPCTKGPMATIPVAP